MAEEKQEVDQTNFLIEEDPSSNEIKGDKQKQKKKQQLLEEAKKAEKRGVSYLSRIPPHMDPLKLRQILSQYGKIQRIYLTPEGGKKKLTSQILLLLSGASGLVDFEDKNFLKGGRKRSSLYYDIWNIKYLSKFKWDDLTEEIAYKNAVREQKLALEISAAKRERDFYLLKVDQSRALSSIEERIKKKQKVRKESAVTSEISDNQFVPRFIRQFPQKKPVATNAEESKPRLSKEAGILSGTS